MTRRHEDGEGTSPFDAWALARLLSGESLNGDLGRVSGTFGAIARRLDATLAGERDGVWRTFLGIQPEGEADALIRVVAAADPSAPAPEGEPWLPLRLGGLPSVPDFPLETLPEGAARLAREGAAAIGCDTGLIAGPMLAVAAGLIGRSASLLVAPNRFAHPGIFLANVGLPGDGKSPALEIASAPLHELERELADAFRVARDAHLAAIGPKTRGGRTPGPPPPVCERVVLHDVTFEALFRILADNPRGLAMILDELSTLLLGLNQYKRGGGNDKPNLLKIWSAAPTSIDRVMNEFREPVRIPHPVLSIAGNLTPAMLSEMGNRRGDDGFGDRWLSVFPDRRPKLKAAARAPVSDDAVRAWEDIARNLRRRTLVQDGDRARPGVVRFTPAGKGEFDRLYDEHVDEVNAPDFPDHLRGPWSKLEEYAARLCLILTLMDHAADPTADGLALPSADVRSARAAWRLIDYFKAHHRRVRAYLAGKGLGGAPEGVRLIRRWLENHPGQASFREGDLTRDLRPLRADKAMAEDALLWLEQRRAIRPVAEPDRPRGAPGRKRSRSWEVHPQLRAPENPENPENPGLGPPDADRAAVSQVSPDLPARGGAGDGEGGGDGRPSI